MPSRFPIGMFYLHYDSWAFIIVLLTFSKVSQTLYVIIKSLNRIWQARLLCLLTRLEVEPGCIALMSEIQIQYFDVLPNCWIVEVDFPFKRPWSSMTKALKARLIWNYSRRWTLTPCHQHFHALNKDFWNTCRYIDWSHFCFPNWMMVIFYITVITNMP